MLTPEYLQGAPAELEALFLRLEEDVIKDICRRIAKEGRLTDSAADQAERLRDLGAGTDYIKEKIAEYSGLSDEAVDRLFFDAAQTSDEFYRNVYDRANKEYSPYEYNDYFQQAVDAAVNQTKGELRNLTQSMGFSYRGSNGQVRFHTAAEAYRDCLDYAFIQTSTGMTDYNTAVRNATRRLTESGLQFVDYASGVRNHADVAVRRAVLTGLSQYTGKISERNAQELDTDIVEVSAHMGARPDHAEWQGRWYSLSGKSKKYPSLVEVTGYGTGAGLKGWNCRHDFYPVIPGISEPSYTEEELKNIDPPPFEYDGRTYTCYEATQRQRYMERAMRKTKRELLAAESTGDKDRFTEKSVLLRRQREDYNKFSKTAGLLTQNERTQVSGFGHSQASKAAWAAKKAKNASGGSSAPVPALGGSSGGNVQNYLNSGLTNGGGSGTINLGYHAGLGNRLKDLSVVIQNAIHPEYKPVSKEYLDSLPRITGIESIQESAERVNPNNYEYNCQRCVVAYEMRRRGFDVTAQNTPSNLLSDTIGLYDFKNVFKNSKWIECNGNGYEEICHYLDNADIGTRIHISYKSKKSFHLFIAEKTENGIIFADPQTGDSEVSNYFNRGISGNTEFARVDNLDVSELVKQCIEVKLNEKR